MSTSLKLLIILAFQIHCVSSNLQAKNKSITELKVLKSSEFELMQKYGSRFYINAFHGKKEGIADLVLVRNKNISPEDLQTAITDLGAENLLYVELITSKNLENEAKTHLFQNGNQSIKEFKLLYEKMFLVNNRTITYELKEVDEPPMLFGRGMIPASRRIVKAEDLFGYIFLLPVGNLEELKMSIGNSSIWISNNKAK